MVHLYLLYNDRELPQEMFLSLLSLLPDKFHPKILNYRRWEDRQASLAGKLLLSIQLLARDKSGTLLSSFTVDEYKRPYLTGGEIDFNISHTKGLVACAVSPTERVGVDVEKLNQVDLTDFSRVFTEEENIFLSSSDDSTDLFFDLWTRKESVMKADGRGFFLDPSSFSGLRSPIAIAQDKWYVKRLDLEEGWVGYLAAKREIQVKELVYTFEDLLDMHSWLRE